MNTQELIKAAKLLNQHCAETGSGCKEDNCPFYDEETGKCLINNYPDRWEITEKED